jgi:hypothetical protein
VFALGLFLVVRVKLDNPPNPLALARAVLFVPIEMNVL